MTSGIAKLENPIRPYAWGSHDFIARLQSRPAPTDRPEAELWIGAHPTAPSRLAGESLRTAIERDPRTMLGARTIERFGESLPYLVKILAAAQPLSIQVHPDAEQAALGFRREDALGLARDAADRNYSDAQRKIELMIALEPFHALCGFRSDAAVGEWLERVGGAALEALRLPSSGAAECLAATAFFALRQAPAPSQARLIEDVVRFAEQHAPAMTEARWILRLHALYPGDVGILAPLLLNLVELAPGEALFVEPGTPHSYLEGSGVEVMSSSDNVVRGGLTAKHVDEAELRRLCARGACAAVPLRTRTEAAGIERFPTPIADGGEFDVRILLPGAAGGLIARPASSGPRVLLTTAGRVRVSESAKSRSARAIALAPGEAAWVPAHAGALRVEAERGAPRPAEVYEISVG